MRTMCSSNEGSDDFPGLRCLLLSHCLMVVCSQKPIIAKSSPLPAEGRQLFTTSIPDQEVIVFEVINHDVPPFAYE